MRVLITGAAGWTGSSILQAMSQAEYEIVGFDLPGVRFQDDTVSLLSQKISGDVSDFEQIRAAVQSTSVDALIHLAVAVGRDDYQTPDIPFAVNVKGTYNVFEAARRTKVKRIVLISSAAVHLPQQRAHISDARADWKSSPDDDHLYDLTKRLQEEIARDFCETYQMQAVVLRSGHLVDGRKNTDPHGRNLETLHYCRGGWVCRYDLAQACVKALEMSLTDYAAFHIIGAEQARQQFDVDRAETELGLRFESRFEHYQ